MNIHETISNAMKDHKNKIEITQWAVMSSVASFVFSEYISNIKQKTKPTRRICVPPIRYVNELMDPSSQFMNLLSEKLIDGIRINHVFAQYANAPELILFDNDHIDIMKTIFDLYMVPNISQRIPETIALKFQLNDEKNQLIYQDNTIDLFNRMPINGIQLEYIINESVLHILTLIPSIRKEFINVESNKSFSFPNDYHYILSINNQEGICPIHFNADIFNNPFSSVLEFLTSTSVKQLDEKNEFNISTGVFNQAQIIRLE